MSYKECKCGGVKTYISVSGELCCMSCFKALDKKEIEPKIDMTAGVYADDGGWAVEVKGVVKKYFSKYEDFASTDAKDYARKLNLESAANADKRQLPEGLV